MLAMVWTSIQPCGMPECRMQSVIIAWDCPWRFQLTWCSADRHCRCQLRRILGSFVHFFKAVQCTPFPSICVLLFISAVGLSITDGQICRNIRSGKHCIHGWSSYIISVDCSYLYRYYQLFLAFSASLQLAGFFIPASTVLWIDKLSYGAIRHVANHFTLNQAALIVMAIVRCRPSCYFDTLTDVCIA